MRKTQLYRPERAAQTEPSVVSPLVRSFVRSRSRRSGSVRSVPACVFFSSSLRRGVLSRARGGVVFVPVGSRPPLGSEKVRDLPRARGRLGRAPRRGDGLLRARRPVRVLLVILVRLRRAARAELAAAWVSAPLGLDAHTWSPRNSSLGFRRTWCSTSPCLIVFRFCARIDTNAPSTRDSTKSSVARVMVLHASFAQFLTSLSSFMMRFTRASGSATSAHSRRDRILRVGVLVHLPRTPPPPRARRRSRVLLLRARLAPEETRGVG